MRFAIGLILMISIMAFFTYQFGWGGGKRSNGHPPWPMA
jgi:hypothetical protein